MSIRKFILKLTPNWVISLGIAMRCLWRCSACYKKIEFQTITPKSALIVAPHPDDETFGCGGLIKLKRAAGVPVRIVLFTDGEAVASARNELRETVVAMRKSEFLNACQQLGMNSGDIRCLHLPDGNIPQSGQPGFEAAAQALLAEIKVFAPGEVFCPHLEDRHSDHIAAARLTQEALRNWSQPCALFSYPMWMWYHASSGLLARLNTAGAWRLDISTVLPVKRQAMAAYLEANKTAKGDPFCGRLPWSFLRNFRRSDEVFFPLPLDSKPVAITTPADSRQLKALFVSPAGAAYGSERSLLALLRARQFDAEVVCPGGGALERELQELEIPVHPLEFGKYSVRQNPFWHFGFYRQFRRIVKASRPDMVVINLDGNTPLVTLAALRAGIPIIRFSRFEFKPPTRWLDRWCWLKAQAVICPSNLVKQQVLAWAPTKFHPRVQRLYESHAAHGSSAMEVAAFRKQFNLKGDKIIGYVGRLHRGKRIETTIEALAQVRGQFANASLLIIGGDDGSPNEMTYKTELQKLAVTLGVGEAVSFTGYLQSETMTAAIAACDVCVLPSESESFGMVLMEAWAQGKPTVASDIGGCREITAASGGGFLVPVGAATNFAERILALLNDPKIAAEMGQNGKMWVCQNCSPINYAAVFKLIMESLSSKTK